MKIYRCPKTGLRKMQAVLRVRHTNPTGVAGKSIVVVNAREMPDGSLLRQVRLLRT